MAEPQTVPDGQIAVISPTGKLGYIPPDQADAAHGAGYRILSTDKANSMLHERKAGALGAVRTFGESAASAATLGAYDVAGRALGGEEFAARRRADEEAFDLAAGLGTAAGVVGTAIATGGTGAVARGAASGAAKAGAIGLAESGAAAGAAARGAMALGRAVTAPARGALALGRGAEALVAGGEVAGRSVRGLLPTLGVTGESLAGRALTGGAKMAASGAVEGAAFGAGEALSEAALAPGGDYSHLAEKVLAGAEHGALFGAALGGGIGTVGGVASKVVSKMAERIGDVRLDKLAHENAVKALAVNKRSARELSNVGDLEAVGKKLLDDDIVRGGRSYEEMLERANNVNETAGRMIGDTMSVLDDAGRGISAKPVFDRIRAELIEPLAKSAVRVDERAARILSQEFKKLEAASAETGMLRFSELHEFRRKLVPQNVWGSPVVPDSVKSGLMKMRGIMDDAIDQGVKREFGAMSRDEIQAIAFKRALANEGDAAAAAQHADSFVASMADGGALKSYLDNKLSFRASRWAQNQLQERAGVSDVVLRGIGLTSNIVGAAGLAGTVASQGLFSGAVTGAAMAAANQYAIRHGRGIIADLAYRASKADTALLGKVKAFVRGTGDTRRAAIGEAAAVDVDNALNKAPKETRGEAFERMAASVRAGPAAQPMVVDSEAPQTGAAMRAVIQKGMAFLATKLPPQQQSPSPFYTAPPASAESVAKFARYVKAVKDPLSVVDSLNSGTMSMEEKEALQAVYPALYEQLKGHVTSELINLEKPLPQAKSVQVGVLFGIPTIPTLDPGNYKVIQATYTVQMQPPQQQQAPSGAPSKVSQSHATEAERLEGQELQI